MKVVIPVLEDMGWDSPISEHFGHAPYFAIIDIGRGGLQIVPNPLPEHGPGDLPRWVVSQGASLLVVKGIGRRAIDHFTSLGVEVIRGANGTVRQIVEALKAGDLRDVPYQVKEKYHRDEG